jgi:alpha-beta hydrolase superfamily lysophospholipase
MIFPSLLLVHGAWHRPEHLQLLVDELSGIDVHTVSLPSSGKDPAALGDMYADAEVVAAAAAAIDGPVVVVAHSYGGSPPPKHWPRSATSDASSTLPPSSLTQASHCSPSAGVR